MKHCSVGPYPTPFYTPRLHGNDVQCFNFRSIQPTALSISKTNDDSRIPTLFYKLPAGKLAHVVPINMSSSAQQSALDVALVLVIVLTPLAILATYLRFVSSRLNFGKVGIEDWLALAGLIFFLAWVVCVSSSMRMAV